MFDIFFIPSHPIFKTYYKTIETANISTMGVGCMLQQSTDEPRDSRFFLNLILFYGLCWVLLNCWKYRRKEFLLEVPHILTTIKSKQKFTNNNKNVQYFIV